jgi:hypothetical protein
MNPVAGKLSNCYSSKDGILKYLFKLVRFDTKPCGLNLIDEKSKKVKNYDVSEKVKGHLEFIDSLEYILNTVDFNRDFNYIINDS